LLKARTRAEAALYVKLQGAAVIGQSDGPEGTVLHARRLSDGTHQDFVFRVAPPAQERSVERMYGGSSPSTIISRQQWLEVAHRLEQSVPSEPTGLLAEVIQECMQELARAAAALYEAAKFAPSGAESDRIAAVGARVNQYSQAMASAVKIRDPSALPLPIHRFRSDDATIAKLESAALPARAGLLLEGGLGSWRLCAEIPNQASPMGLFVDDGGALLQASLSDGQLVALKRLEGRAGLRAWIKAGFGLGPAEAAIVEGAVRSGRRLDEGVERLVAAGHRCDRVVSVYGHGEEMTFCEVAIRGPELVRGGLLLVILGPDGKVRGHRTLGGLVGYNQLSVMKEAQGLLPGSFEGADAETVSRLSNLSDHIFTQIAQAAYPLLAAFIGAANPAELSAALRPSDADYAAVFGPELVDQAREKYGALWAAGSLHITVPRDRENVLIAACTAGGLSFPNQHSRHFHPRMAAMSEKLVRRRTWLTWKYLRPGEERGQLYDGLVWIDDHWAWFPHTWELLDF